MPTPVMEKLLILQHRDTMRLKLVAQLKALPGEVLATQQKIAGEKAAIESARSELLARETRKRTLESELAATEVKLAKYRTQQSQVRKNDEFRALGTEIETTQAAIGVLEGQQLEVMYLIDEARGTFAGDEKARRAEIAVLERRIAALHEREANLKKELSAAEAVVAEARGPIEAPVLKIFDRIAVRTQPVCVPLRGVTCSGCHLKVSAEVESAARGKGDAKLATCDQCGRIVWWEPA